LSPLLQFHLVASEAKKLKYGFCDTQYTTFKNRLMGEDASALSTGTLSTIKGMAMKVGLKRIPDVAATANQILPAILNPFLYHAREEIYAQPVRHSARFTHDIEDLNENAEDFAIYAFETHLVNEQRKYVASVQKHHGDFKKGHWNKSIRNEFIDLCEMTKASVAGFLHAFDLRATLEEPPTIPYNPDIFIEDVEQTETELIKEEEYVLEAKRKAKIARREEKEQRQKRKKEEKERKDKEKQEKKQADKKARAPGKGKPDSKDDNVDDDDTKSIASDASSDMDEEEAEKELRKLNGEDDDDNESIVEVKKRVPRTPTAFEIRKEDIFKKQAIIMANYFIYDFNLRYKHKVLTEYRQADRSLHLLNKAKRKHMTGITNRASPAFDDLIIAYGDAVMGKNNNEE
jgi:hypothetical protein